MVNSKGVRNYDKPTIRLTGLCDDEGLDARDVINRQDNRLRADGRGGGFEWVEKSFDERRRWRIVQQRDPCDSRRNLISLSNSTIYHPVTRLSG